MDQIKLHKYASVVELNAARKVIHQLGLSARMGNHDDEELMLIYDGKYREGYALYTKEKESPCLTSFFIDEGVFTDTMDIEGKLHSSMPWEQLVDFRSLLSLVKRILEPSTKHPESSAIGRGRRQQDLISGYIDILKDNKAIDWLE